MSPFATSLFIHQTGLILRWGVIAFGGLLVPAQRQRFTFRNPDPGHIEPGQRILTGQILLLSCLLEPVGSLARIVFNAKRGNIHDTEPKLSRSIAVFRQYR